MSVRSATTPTHIISPTNDTTPATKRYHTWHAASSWGCRYQRNEAMTHCTSDDASTVALLLTCLARRAIRRAGLRVFACQTATKRYHTWHAASSWGCRYQRDGAMTHSTPDDAPTVALLLTCLARRANERSHSAGLRRVFACQTATMRYHTWHAASSWGCRYQRDEAMTHCTPDDTLLLQHCSSPASHAVQSADPASEYLPVRQPPCVTTPGTQRRHGAAGISEMEL